MRFCWYIHKQAFLIRSNSANSVEQKCIDYANEPFYDYSLLHALTHTGLRFFFSICKHTEHFRNTSFAMFLACVANRYFFWRRICEIKIGLQTSYNVFFVTLEMQSERAATYVSLHSQLRSCEKQTVSPIFRNIRDAFRKSSYVCFVVRIKSTSQLWGTGGIVFSVTIETQGGRIVTYVLLHLYSLRLRRCEKLTVSYFP